LQVRISRTLDLFWKNIKKQLQNITSPSPKNSLVEKPSLEKYPPPSPLFAYGMSNPQALQKTLKPAPQTSSAPSFISRLFGLRTLPPVPYGSPQQGEVVMPLDIMRQQAVEGYESMRKYIEEHGEEILEEDKKREQQMLNESKMSLVGFMGRFGGGGAPPPPPVSADDKAGK
jgi:hypothetical protein